MPNSILRQFSAHGVQVNNLVIPGRSIESVLSRHALNLVINNDDELFKVSLVGSATAVRFQGREILLTTQHQLRNFDPRQVAMLTDSGSHIITSGGVRGYGPHPDTDAYDIAAFDFTEPCADRPEFKKRFFDLLSGPPDVLNAQVLGLLLSGYPTIDQEYDVHENNHLGLARRNVVCQPYSQPSDQALLTVQAVQPLEVHPDGMSGGSAFVIQLESGHPRAYFAGLIVRGGKTTFQILKAGYVIAFLNSVFAEE
ncbi:hypothetical protein HGP16_27710 [Rhizobium sp. P40RR-XXII]|uniref:hypothetical protein n=1 Tax=Rhizobium sp. P40RR-XXII TaxID=2726739 RepID=UPI001456705F|nr:hypothetical protein [Rhizobium sp. P40RR-XXII]NLS20321.1 hypothetical protein [Rhizobium sp. P40RR-XXII]